MQLSSDVRIPDSLLAANALLSEKPHQEVPSLNLALHQGIDERNSTAAIGLRVGQHLNRAWSRYTGKERDAESGLDYFGARYYGSNMGRFMSPDYSDDQDPVPFANFSNPQSMNLYSYGLNNPTSNSDDSGHDVNVCTNDASGNQQCTLLTNEQYSAATQGNGSLNVPSLNSPQITLRRNFSRRLPYIPTPRSCRTSLYYSRNRERMITAVDCTIVRFDTKAVMPEFFIYYAQSNGYLNTVASKCTGTTRNRISRANLAEVELTLPSIREQARIVDILDEAFEGIATAQANAEQSLENSRALFSSYLDNLEGTKRALGSLVDIKTGKLDANAAVVGGTYPFFTCSREIYAIDKWSATTGTGTQWLRRK